MATTKKPAKKPAKKAPAKRATTPAAEKAPSGPELYPVPAGFDPATMSAADAAELAPAGFCSADVDEHGAPLWVGPFPGDPTYPGVVS